MIEIADLTIKYGAKQVVNQVSLQIKQGSFTTLVGPNGCGKSTLLKAVGRIVKPVSGNIYLFNQNIKTLSSKEIAKRIAILPQIRKTPEDFDTETLIRYGRYPHGNFAGKLTDGDRAIIEWAIKKTGMSHHRFRKLSHMSGGEQQRAWIAMALAQKTELIILDEPTSFLDLAHQLDVLELLKKLNREEGVTILLVLHDLNQAIRFSDYTYVMKKGEIVNHGKPDEVIISDTLRRVFYVDSDFYEDKRTYAPYFIAHSLGGPNVRCSVTKRKT